MCSAADSGRRAPPRPPEERPTPRGLPGWLLWPSRLLTSFFLLCIAGYQRFISPALPPACRFEPSCSEYTAQSLRKFGLVRGLLKGVWRLLRCQPLCKGGYDPP